VHSPATSNVLADRRILLTGVAGTVGGELARQLLDEHGVAHLLAIDNSEHGVFQTNRAMGDDSRFACVLGDVRDPNAMRRLMRDVDTVFHASAYKHVAACERSPQEAVATNILATQNVVDAAIEAGVQRVIFTSTDKAVAPSTVMGATKLVAERIVTAANASLGAIGPVLASTRFGNVLGSSGSVIPIFRQQIKQGGPVTVTDPVMTRFVMSLADAVRLVIDTACLARGGEVFVTKMPVIRITDLAHVMIQELAPRYGHDPASVNVQFIGAFPGERLSEGLLDVNEVGRSIELERYYVTLPPMRQRRVGVSYDDYPDTVSKSVAEAYESATQPTMDQQQLLAFLNANDLLLED